MMKKDKIYKSEDEKIYMELSDAIKYQIQRLDSLDIYTSKHTHTVPIVTKKLCEKLAIDEPYTKLCINSAYLHDIGKIFIDPKILQKNDKLNDKEYEMMKNHTIYGYNFCIAMPELRRYAKAARSHHENQNGTGYPDKLSGEQIPLNIDIVKIADIYDALTTRRQYKEECSRAEAVKIIYEEACGGFINMRVFKALLEIIIEDMEDEVEQINIAGNKKDIENGQYILEDLDVITRIKEEIKT